MDDSKSSTIEFSIGGMNFNVSTDMGRDKVLELADYVNKKIAMYDSNNGNSSYQKKILLAMMEVAGDYIEANEKVKELEAKVSILKQNQNELDEKAANLINSIEDLENFDQELNEE